MQINASIKTLEEALELFEKSSGNDAAIQNYEHILSELENLPDMIEMQAGVTKMLLEHVQYDLDSTGQFGKLVSGTTKYTQDFAHHFTETLDRAQQGGKLNRLKKSLISLIKSIKGENFKLWAAYLAARNYQLDKVYLDLVQEKSHDSKIRSYREKRKHVPENQPPRNQQEFDIISITLEELISLKAQIIKFKDDLSPEVQKFLEDVTSGASIELSEEVLKYLKDKQQLHHYGIYRRPET